MSSSGARSLRGNLTIFAVVLALLTGGTWGIQRIATERLLDLDAVSTAHNWAGYLAQSVNDLEAIAAGAPPSAASESLLRRTQKVGNIFQYNVFDPHGRLRLSGGSAAVPADAPTVAQHNPAAAAALAAGHPFTVVKTGTPPAAPAFFTEAYVPVRLDGRVIAIVEVYVDQTEKHRLFHATFLFAALSLSALTALAFMIPTIAWYRRTREKVRAEERARFLADHDALTGLINRTRLATQLTGLLTATPAGRAVIAVHYINIDRLKDVNDALGHLAGDELIKAIAARLREIARERDVVARVGGDEFALAQAAASRSAVEKMARRLAEAVAAPLRVDNRDVDVTASIGVALAPADGDDAHAVIKTASLAMHACKAAGGNGIRYFAPEMDRELQKRLALERTIRSAIANDGFELHFQPVVGMPEGRLVGFEALLRLRGPDGGLISPARFIPVAEELGLIDRLGAWVITEACRTATSWPEHLRVAVNLSPAQFASDVRATVATALAASGLAPARLELEITESLFMDASTGVANELAALKALGVSIAMDDFGTGYSSLSYLWRFPFDKIKIDRAFVVAPEADRNRETVLRAVIGLGRSLGLQVTVEGVETAQQAALVRGLRCHQIQGFYFGRPMPAAELAAFILADFHGGTVLPAPAAPGVQVA
ncbi:MAG TPA: EAL domain-containing protein [Xanthobacteraceae bacterium]|nr:EAL domain-containing protein [Xanthobacteraceae bacterium]